MASGKPTNAILLFLIMLFEHFLYMVHAFYLMIDAVDTYGPGCWEPPGKDSVYDAFDRDHHQSAALLDTVR